MGRFDTILWDVDGTLLDFPKSERYALSYCFEHFHLEMDKDTPERYSKINDSFWKRLELGEIENKQEVLLGRFEILFRELGITHVSSAEFQEIYKDALGSVYFYRDNSLTLCKSLQGHFRQYIVTNGVAYTQEKKLRLSGLYELMDDVFISEQVGYPKPNPEFFRYCFEKIKNADKNRIIIVGDSLSSDMKGGDNAGITTCWYNPAGIEKNLPVRTDYEIRTLQELLPILEA